MSLTPEQLEVAARKLCELEGLPSDHWWAGQALRIRLNLDAAIAHARGESESGEARKMVLREPTDEMIAAANWAGVGKGALRQAWCDMWDAAPRGE